MNIGNVVEYIDNQRIICAVVIDIKNLRLRLLTENNKEVKLTANRLSHKKSGHLDVSMGRDKLIESLKRISARRKEMIPKVNIEELWEVLHSEGEWIDLETMTEFCFPEQQTSDHESAVMRAFFQNRIFFKFDHTRFLPYSKTEVEKISAMLADEQNRQELINNGATWVKAVLSGNPISPPLEARRLTEILKDYYLFEKNARDWGIAQSIIKKAGLQSLESIFKFMVKVDAWDMDENIDIQRYNTPTDFTGHINKTALELIHIPIITNSGPPREDLTHLDLMTIDGQSTSDFDDAISIENMGKYFKIGVHIADVGHYVKKNDAIDKEALRRASSIYMPDRKISMVPGELADNLCSLKANELRPAISTFIDISPNADITDYRIVPSTIRIARQLTYSEVNLIANEDERIIALHKVAQAFRKKRFSQGAVQISLPEINIWLNNENEPQLTRVDRESAGRFLVSELMILANWIAAGYLKKNNLPAIFRAQPAPKERLYAENEGSLYQNWMQRKLLSRFILGKSPEHHSGLGLNAYVTATSPIRKYFDLVTQRQLRAGLGFESAYTADEIANIIHLLEQPMGNITKLQNRRQRYWLLRYLEKKVGQKEEAVVLARRRNGYAVLLKKYMIECLIPEPGGIALKPEDLIQITLQHVNARKDTLAVFMR
ncbi:MAG: RNB domain-containing ribonuclease [Desulfobacteraceae bacterium]|nr:RNB domain-containing ribonuclease [Desulfobacteraceae bacterium]